MKLGMQVGLGPGHIVLDGNPAFPPPRGTAPIFGPYLLWPNGWMDQDRTWHGGGPWSRPHCARWDPAPFPKKGAEPPIFGPFCSGQTAGWIKMPLGTKVGLSLGNIVLDGTQLQLP